MDGSERTSVELFEALLNTPMHFTLDQLLALDLIFWDRFYSMTWMPNILEMQKVFEENVGNHQIIPKDVDFIVPIVELEFNGQVFPQGLLDGGS